MNDYKQIDEQFDEKFTYQDPIISEGYRVVSSGKGTNGWNVFTAGQIKDFLHLIYDQAKAEQREEDARIAERKLKEITDGMFNAAINSGRGIGSITEVHYNDACLDIATAIRQEGE